MSYIKKVDDDILSNLERFHGALVPGLIIGAYMVELAYEKLGDVEMVDAVVETKKCIADAVQLMTSCTLGNGWLKVYNWGIFAITLYDKKSKKGVRVYLDTKKIPKISMIHKWFFREIGKNLHNEVNKEIFKLKKSILSYEYVNVVIEKKKSARIIVCSKCGQPFPSEGSKKCLSCMERVIYYKKV